MFGKQWQAIQHEAQLAAAQAAHGATVLGRANHAQIGYYTQAFFALSIGLERIGKLIFLSDYIINSGGTFPTNQDLRNIGHDQSSLLFKCEKVSISLNPDRDYIVRPNDPIHSGIQEVLSLFATKLRYYNLNRLTAATQTQQDPVALWWEKVATPICDRHYPQQQRRKAESRAALVEHILGDKTVVIHSTETGEGINNLHTLFTHDRKTSVIQKYGQFYTLQIVRWLSSIMFELSHIGAYEKRMETLIGLDEPFSVFLNNDKYLRGRKAWSIYPK